jgi:orotidine-5'-phosphate decarboxylase
MSNRVIVALDFESRREALSMVELLGPQSCAYKVGLQMLTEEGPEIVRSLVAMGKEVFLDLKVHEIPNSVAGAVAAAGKLGASMVTVHASGGSSVLSSAVEAARPYPQLRVLALTVITSLTDQDLPEIGLAPSVIQQVERLGRLAASQGCHGVVASAQEAALLHKILPVGTLIVTPGIHLYDTPTNDQSRVATPSDASRAGSTHIVIGRAITRATNPLEAFQSAVRGFTGVRD